jgi:hypothetical protein
VRIDPAVAVVAVEQTPRSAPFSASCRRSLLSRKASSLRRRSEKSVERESAQSAAINITTWTEGIATSGSTRSRIPNVVAPTMMEAMIKEAAAAKTGRRRAAIHNRNG